MPRSQRAAAIAARDLRERPRIAKHVYIRPVIFGLIKLGPKSPAASGIGGVTAVGAKAMRSRLQEAAEALAGEGIFLGGPVSRFHAIGRHQLITLLEHGLLAHHKVLDVGCGALRAGYWLINFLQPGGYFGLEPNRKMLTAGLEALFDPALLAHKRPSFDHNDRFDFSVFDAHFDFVIARSIWTHAAPAQIEAMLDQFCAHGAPEAVFLTSYKPAKFFQRQYDGDEWVGRSHRSDRPGMVRYRFRWLRARCEARGLTVERLQRNVMSQTWLKITKPP